MTVEIIGEVLGSKTQRQLSDGEVPVWELDRLWVSTTSDPTENENDIEQKLDADFGIRRGAIAITTSGVVVWVTDISTQETDGNGVNFWRWETEVSYSSAVRDNEETEDAEKPPEQRKAKWRSYAETQQRRVDVDMVNGQPIVNAADQPLPVEDFHVVSVWSIERYERDTPANLEQKKRDLVNHVNSVAFEGAEPKTLLCSMMAFQPAEVDGDPNLHLVTYTLKYWRGIPVPNEPAEIDGWMVRLENFGSMAKDPNDGNRIKPLIWKVDDVQASPTFGKSIPQFDVPHNEGGQVWEGYLKADGTIGDEYGTIPTAKVGPFNVKPVRDFNGLINVN